METSKNKPVTEKVKAKEEDLKVGNVVWYWEIKSTVRKRGKDTYRCVCTLCNSGVEYDICLSRMISGQKKCCGCVKSSEIRKRYFKDQYGVENVSQLKEVKQRKKDTALSNYGVENISQSEEIKQKKINTTLKNFGVSFPQQSEEVKAKSKTSYQEKYGVDHISQSEEIKERKRFTFVLQNPEVIEHTKNLNLERYGFASHMQHDKYRYSLRNWCDQNIDKLSGSSQSETKLLEWIKTIHPSAKKVRIEGKELDIFIPEINIGIEFDGLYWHCDEVAEEKLNLLQKTNYFNQRGIKVIHILEHEWNQRESQVKSFLKSKLGCNQERIAARKCELVWSSSEEEILKAGKLITQTHIQKMPRNTKYVANCYYEGRLVGTACFGPHHRGTEQWVLTRYCTIEGVTVQGLLSKVSKIASEELKQDIISWADRRFSEGEGYRKAGWIEEEVLPPDYMYFKGLNVISKQSRQKKLIGTPTHMTESEHAKMDGLRRIWDCGKIRFKFLYKKTAQ